MPPSRQAPSRSSQPNRRRFVQRTAVTLAAAVCSGCSPPPQDPPVPPTSPAAGKPPATPAKPPPAASLSREAVLTLADGTAHYYMGVCHNCAQSTFLALHETFGIGDPSLVKALTPLPGIAERGETCGAVVASLLALGFVYGRERLNDWAGWRACLVPTRTFCERFAAEFGSTQCGDVVEKLFGQRYNLADPADLGKFQDAGAGAKCSRVVRTAVRLAAELMLEKAQPS